MTNRSRDWFILRTAPANTLRLVQTLAWADIEAWSPIKTEVERETEQRSRRVKRTAIMPSFVFARTEHLMDLLAIREAPASPHPAFSFLRHLGEISFIPDGALDALRVAEQKQQPAEAVRQWKEGDRVRYPASGFEGLVGTVLRSTKKSAWVDFGLPWPQEAPAALLLDATSHERRAA